MIHFHNYGNNGAEGCMGCGCCAVLALFIPVVGLSFILATLAMVF